jgi:nucleoside-diphosphate-sugar epimerase
LQLLKVFKKSDLKNIILKKKILITGSTGFIGSHIKEFLLEKNYLVIDILRKKNKKKIKKIYKNYKPIFYNNIYDLEKKIKKIQYNIIINCATFYSKNYDCKTVLELIKTNILFSTLIIIGNQKNLKKIINFDTMMQHSINENFNPMNVYAITKFAHKNISKFIISKNKNIKFYNFKLYETFGLNDKRNKLIPSIIKNYKKNKFTNIISDNLEMNFTNINYIIQIIEKILNKNLYTPKEYILKNYKSVNIRELINECNQKLKKKIKVKYLSSKKINLIRIKNSKIQNINLKSNIKDFILENIN